MNRRRFLTLSASGGLALVGLNGCVFEPGRVTVTRHALGRPGADPAPPLRLVQLSDLHLQRVDAHARRVAASVSGLAPHVVLFTGDAIDRADKAGELDAFLRLLPAAVPKYAILGNWEHWGRVDVAELDGVYAAHNGRLLVNASATVSHHGREALLIGLDDVLGGTPDFARAVRGAAPCPNRLLLAHCPTARDRLAAELRFPQPGGGSERGSHTRHAPQYVLSGHTHGGQIALAGFAPLRPPESGRYVSGRYQETAPPLYVSRGLGTSVLPVRFGAPPEIALFEWFLSPA